MNELVRNVLSLMKKEKIKIFIINFEPLKDRREYLQKKFLNFGLIEQVKWIIQKKGEYSKKFLQYSPSKNKWNKLSKKIDNEGFRVLRESDFSIKMNHKKIHDIIKREKIPISLILEDDVILEDDFLYRLKRCLEILPTKFDICYTDAGMNLRLPKKIKKFKFYLYKKGLIRTTASYFVSLEGARKLSKPFDFVLPVDWEFKYREKDEGVKAYWLNGYLTYQGSLYGKHYNTTMQTNRDSFGRIRRFLLNLEKNRYESGFFSKVAIFFFDFFYIIPYRYLRILCKKIKNIIF